MKHEKNPYDCYDVDPTLKQGWDKQAPGYIHDRATYVGSWIDHIYRTWQPTGPYEEEYGKQYVSEPYSLFDHEIQELAEYVTLGWQVRIDPHALWAQGNKLRPVRILLQPPDRKKS